MLEAGLLDEVRSLLSRGVNPDCTAMQAIGYKESALYLKGELRYEEAVARIKQASRRYAKRQLTWFRRWTDAVRLERGPAVDVAADLEMLKRKGFFDE